MGSNPLSHIANSVGYSVVNTQKMAEESAHRQAKLIQEAHAANNASYGASSAYDELGRKYERFADVLIKGRNEVRRAQDRLYISQLDQQPISSTCIRPVAVPPPHTTTVHTTTQFPYGQPTPPASPQLHPTAAPYAQFPYGQPTPPGSPPFNAIAQSYGEIPQFSDLGAAHQAQALSQQPGLSLADQQQLLEAFLAQQSEKSHAPFANEQVNPQQRIMGDHDLGARPSESRVNQFMNRDLELEPYSRFKEDYPQTRQKISALASEVPTPITITSKIGLDNPLGKTRRLSKLQQINDHRIHILKLINSSKLTLSDRDDVARYSDEIDRIIGGLQRFATECNQSATDGRLTYFTKPDNRKLGSYASQLSQTAEQLRAILHSHADRMPTKKDQANNFTAYLVDLNRQVKNDFADAYSEAKTKETRETLVRKLRTYNHDIKAFLKNELPNPGAADSEYNHHEVDRLNNLIQPIKDKEIDSLIEYKKADLRMGDALKAGAVGSVLTIAAASLAKATGINGLTQPILRLGLGGTAAGMLFSSLPAKIREPLMQGEPAKAFENIFQRAHQESWFMQDPNQRIALPKKAKQTFFSQF